MEEILLVARKKAPPNPITGRVHLPFDNSIVDQYGHSITTSRTFTFKMETDGDAAVVINNAQDKIIVKGSQDLLVAGDFTIELNLALTATSNGTGDSTRMLFGFLWPYNSQYVWSVRYNQNNNFYVQFANSSSFLVVSQPWELNNYAKVALCRKDGMLKLVFNGILLGQRAEPTNMPNPKDLVLGAAHGGAAGYSAFMNIKDMIFLNGQSLY